MENKFSFTDKSGSTRSGFYHKSTLREDGKVISTAKVNYLNRTWENYTFQTSRRKAVTNLVDEVKADIISEYKREKGISRIKQETKEELYAQDSFLIELDELYKSL